MKYELILVDLTEQIIDLVSLNFICVKECSNLNALISFFFFIVSCILLSSAAPVAKIIANTETISKPRTCTQNHSFFIL